MYGKFVKVKIISHHGNEHYCPISIFKVFGTPEIELVTFTIEHLQNKDNQNQIKNYF